MDIDIWQNSYKFVPGKVKNLSGRVIFRSLVRRLVCKKKKYQYSAVGISARGTSVEVGGKSLAKSFLRVHCRSKTLAFFLPTHPTVIS